MCSFAPSHDNCGDSSLGTDWLWIVSSLLSTAYFLCLFFGPLVIVSTPSLWLSDVFETPEAQRAIAGREDKMKQTGDLGESSRESCIGN